MIEDQIKSQTQNISQKAWQFIFPSKNFHFYKSYFKQPNAMHSIF